MAGETNKRTCGQLGLWKGVKPTTGPSASQGCGISVPRDAMSHMGLAPPTKIPLHHKASSGWKRPLHCLPCLLDPQLSHAAHIHEATNKIGRNPSAAQCLTSTAALLGIDRAVSLCHGRKRPS